MTFLFASATIVFAGMLSLSGNLDITDAILSTMLIVASFGLGIYSERG